MNKVVNINSKRIFGDFYPQAPDLVPEGLKFLAIAVLSFVAPALAYCYVTNHVQPLALVAGTLIIGVVFGIARHLKRPTDPNSCVPVHYVPDSSCDAREEDAA